MKPNKVTQSPEAKATSHMNDRYDELADRKIIQTVERLELRIADRFPKSGIRAVCGRLLEISQQASARCRKIRSPLWGIRLLIGTCVLAIIAGSTAVSIYLIRPPDGGRFGFAEGVQIFEAGINDLILLGAAIFFLTTIEARIKRSRALRALHELRSLAHIIDMHQLTKDPERTLTATGRTKHSPQSQLTAFELSRYLDYCSEMLSLIGKNAALYAQGFNDAQTVAAVNDIESLTSGMSRKIWQKIMILNTYRQGPTSASSSPAEQSEPTRPTNPFEAAPIDLPGKREKE
ncbi:hypothetical protein [Stratiformator vulcanicus]|uniref:Uncharacterized protein n=1 Tax=Stratiformator vulcanicus TaxID=2527980 RepID=A0A517R4L5_9PLAN|nr:hypothetical protein [Stratiformator vulcanicus]QDT38824.1 hypothetical protein Pan189_32230 [Stratiformator vulcanicus]